MLDWARLMDQCKTVEARIARSKSGGPALCQEPWTDCGLSKSAIDKPVGSGRSVSVYSPSVDVTRQ